MLDNNATVSDETLFAATIILRVLEEIDSKIHPFHFRSVPGNWLDRV